VTEKELPRSIVPVSDRSIGPGGINEVVVRPLLVVLVTLNIFVWGGLFAFESMVAATSSVSSTAKITHNGSVLTSSR
jgi:hypothetical protein